MALVTQKFVVTMNPGLSRTSGEKEASSGHGVGSWQWVAYNGPTYPEPSDLHQLWVSLTKLFLPISCGSGVGPDSIFLLPRTPCSFLAQLQSCRWLQVGSFVHETQQYQQHLRFPSVKGWHVWAHLWDCGSGIDKLENDWAGGIFHPCD